MSGSGDQATWTIENGVCTMVFERRINAPIQRVWHALTDHRELAQWFFPIDGHLVEGSEIVIRWDEEPLHSTVIARETPNLLAWTWHRPGEPESVVRWELFDEGEETRFVLTHHLPILAANEPTDTLAGWHEHIDCLVDQVEGSARPWSGETWRTL